MPFEQWRSWLNQTDIRSKADFERWCKEHTTERERLRIPASPAYSYAQFPGWRFVFGKHPDTSGRGVTKYRPFKEVRAWVRSLKLSKVSAWQTFAQTERDQLHARGCPATPDRVADYRNDWRGWRDFLGTDIRAATNYKQQ
jgi:hypothetical protein